MADNGAFTFFTYAENKYFNLAVVKDDIITSIPLFAYTGDEMRLGNIKLSLHPLVLVPIAKFGA